MDKTYTTKKISDSTIEVTLTIPSEPIKSSYETLLTKELSKTNLKGFRKGATPRELIESQLQPGLLFEVINRLAPIYLSKAVEEEKIELIASPEYKDIPTLELDKPVTIKVELTIMPEFKLGNMKKIKVEIKKERVKTEEVDNIIKQLEENKNIKAKIGTNAWITEASKLIQIENVDTIEKLKEEITKALQAEKDNILKRNAENEALNEAIKLSKIDVPDPAIHFEAHEREHSFEHQLEGMKTTLDQYAKTYGVTIEHMREMWHKDAKEALETDVFLKLFAKERKIQISDEQLKEEIEKVKKSNSQNPEMYDNPEWKEYIRRVALKQRAYELFIKEIFK